MVRKMGARKVVVKNTDMSEEIQQDSIEIVTQTMRKLYVEKEIAAFTKKLWKPTFISATPLLKFPIWILVVFWCFILI